MNDEINFIESGFNGGIEAMQGQSTYLPAALADLVTHNGIRKYRYPDLSGYPSSMDLNLNIREKINRSGTVSILNLHTRQYLYWH